LSDLLKEESIESFMAPSREENQIAWLYAYDYCEAVWGEFNLITYNETINSLIIDVDFEKLTFDFIDLKEF